MSEYQINMLKDMDEGLLQEYLLDTMDILYGSNFSEESRRAALDDTITIMREQLARSLRGEA